MWDIFVFGCLFLPYFIFREVASHPSMHWKKEHSMKNSPPRQRILLAKKPFFSFKNLLFTRENLTLFVIKTNCIHPRCRVVTQVCTPGKKSSRPPRPAETRTSAVLYLSPYWISYYLACWLERPSKWPEMKSHTNLQTCNLKSANLNLNKGHTVLHS